MSEQTAVGSVPDGYWIRQFLKAVLSQCPEQKDNAKTLRKISKYDQEVFNEKSGKNHKL